MADQNNYTIPFGINPAEFFKGVADMDKNLQALEDNVNSANKNMRDSFVVAGKGSDDLSNKIKANAEAAVVLRNTARDLGKEISSALTVKGDAKGLDNLVSKFQAELLKVQKGAKVQIDVEFNEATIREIANAVQQGSAELEVFNQVIAQAKTNLEGLAPGSQEFESLNKQIQLAEGLMEGFAQAEKLADGGSTSLRGQLRAMREELARLELAGEAGSEKFVKLQVEAGKLQDQIGDTSQRIKILASDTKYLDAGIQAVTALAGSFAIAQGAAALLGSEDEALQETIKKVYAAMSILQGVQAIANALNKDSALNVLLFSKAQAAQAVTTEAVAGAMATEAVATEGAAAATTSFTAALAANPIALLIIALVGAGVAIYEFTHKEDAATKQARELTLALKEQSDVIALDENSFKNRADKLVAAIQLEGATRKGQTVNALLQAKIQAQTDAAVTQAQRDALASRVRLLASNVSETAELYNKAQGNRKIDGAKVKEFQEAYNKAQFDFNNASAELEVADIKQKEQAATQRTELRKQELEFNKSVKEQIQKFKDEAAAADISTLRNSVLQQIELVKQETKSKIAELKNEIPLSKEAITQRNIAIQSLEKAQAASILKIQQEAAVTRAELEFANASKILSAQKDTYENAINLLNLNKLHELAQLKEQYKDRVDAAQQVADGEIAIDIAYEKQRVDTKLKYDQENIDLQEKTQILLANVIATKAGLSVQAEKDKEKKVLEIQLKFAQARLDALKAAGKTEADQVVIDAEAAVNAGKDAITKLKGDQPSKITLFTLLGLDDVLTGPQEDAIKNAVDGVLTATKQITDAVIAGYQSQIDARNANISSTDDEIKTLEDQLNAQLELRKEGYANTAELIQKEIADKENQKNEEIRQRNEAIEEQKKAQRIQLVIDTISQGSALITASAKVLQGFASIPIVGVPLGIAAVAIMIGGFVAAKIQALNAINSAGKQSMGEGGWIDGAPHSQGGKKYYAKDGSVTELEGGEHVTSKGQASRFGPLLEAINSDDISHMSDTQLRGLLSGLGVHLSDVEGGLNEARANEAALFSITKNNSSSLELGSMDESLKYLASAEKARVTQWEDSNYTYIKKGSKTTRKKKIS